MNYELIAIISSQLFTAIMIIIAVMTMLSNVNKKIDNLKDENTNLKIEVSEKITRVEIQIEKLNSKFGIVEEKQIATQERLVKTNQ